MIREELLEILACPETKEKVYLADAAMVAKVNEKIRAGGLKNRGGEDVTEAIDGGLIREDRKYLYVIRNDIPIMLIDKAIPMEGIA